MNQALLKSIVQVFYSIFPAPVYPMDLHTHSTISDGHMHWYDVLVHYSLIHKKCLITDHISLSDFDAKLKLIREIPSEYRGAELFIGEDDNYDEANWCCDLLHRNHCVVLFHSSSRRQTDWVIRNANIDILAHPGFITPVQAQICRIRGIALEITSNPLRRYANLWTRWLAHKYKVRLSYGTDAHFESQLLRS